MSYVSPIPLLLNLLASIAALILLSRVLTQAGDRKRFLVWALGTWGSLLLTFAGLTLLSRWLS